MEISTQGVKEVTSRLDALAGDLDHIATDTAAAIADTARSLVKVRTGTLQRSITTARATRGAAVRATAPYAARNNYRQGKPLHWLETAGTTAPIDQAAGRSLETSIRNHHL